MQQETLLTSPPISAPREEHLPVGAPVRWTPATRVAFRFGFVYFALFNFDVLLHLLPFPPFTQILWLFNSVRGHLVVWVSKQVLHLAHDFATDYLNPTTGTKDTTYYYVQALCWFTIAAIAALLWSLWDRKRLEYAWLHRWFLLVLRVSLAAAMISYGAAKLFAYQFPAPLPSQLVAFLGNSTRNDLLWMFMGVSPVYSFFGGLIEVIGGVLLMVPNLATLGALISVGAVGNVLMLNFGYDVGAKLLIIHLMLMAIIILLPDVPRLANVFVWNRNAPAAVPKPLFRRRALDRAMLVLQIAFAVVLLSYDTVRSYQHSEELAASRNVPLHGIWFVDEYRINGEPRPPMSDNPHRWQRLIINSDDQVVVQVMTGATQSLFPHLNARAKKLVLTEEGLPGWIAELDYDDSTAGRLVLAGKMGGVPVLIRLHREDDSQFPLTDHHLHWIHDAVQ